VWDTRWNARCYYERLHEAKRENNYTKKINIYSIERSYKVPKYLSTKKPSMQCKEGQTNN